jgi:hypothetical protein
MGIALIVWHARKITIARLALQTILYHALRTATLICCPRPVQQRNVSVTAGFGSTPTAAVSHALQTTTVLATKHGTLVQATAPRQSAATVLTTVYVMVDLRKSSDRCNFRHRHLTGIYQDEWYVHHTHTAVVLQGVYSFLRRHAFDAVPARGLRV